MVSVNTCELICRELSVRQERSVSVDSLMIKQCKLREHPRISVDDCIVIHDLAEAQDALVAYERIHVGCRKHAAVVIDIRCRYA